MTPTPVTTAVLISGSGSNLQALIDFERAGTCPYRIDLVIANQACAGGIERARQAGVTVQLIEHRAFDSRAAFDAAIDAALRAHAIEMVCLAGFMRILTAGFIEGWQGRMINIHPSLLPSFRGLHTHKQALDAGVTIHGCTVHLVVPDLDAGPILAQAAIPVMPGDTPQSLAERLLPREHRLLPATAARLARQLRGLPDSLPANTDAELFSPATGR